MVAKQTMLSTTPWMASRPCGSCSSRSFAGLLLLLIVQLMLMQLTGCQQTSSAPQNDGDSRRAGRLLHFPPSWMSAFSASAPSWTVVSSPVRTRMWGLPAPRPLSAPPAPRPLQLHLRLQQLESVQPNVIPVSSSRTPSTPSWLRLVSRGKPLLDLVESVQSEARPQLVIHRAVHAAPAVPAVSTEPFGWRLQPAVGHHLFSPWRRPGGAGVALWGASPGLQPLATAAGEGNATGAVAAGAPTLALNAKGAVPAATWADAWTAEEGAAELEVKSTTPATWPTTSWATDKDAVVEVTPLTPAPWTAPWPASWPTTSWATDKDAVVEVTSLTPAPWTAPWPMSSWATDKGPVVETTSLTPAPWTGPWPAPWPTTSWTTDKDAVVEVTSSTLAPWTAPWPTTSRTTTDKDAVMDVTSATPTPWTAPWSTTSWTTTDKDAVDDTTYSTPTPWPTTSWAADKEAVMMASTPTPAPRDSTLDSTIARQPTVPVEVSGGISSNDVVTLAGELGWTTSSDVTETTATTEEPARTSALVGSGSVTGMEEAGLGTPVAVTEGMSATVDQTTFKGDNEAVTLTTNLPLWTTSPEITEDVANVTSPQEFIEEVTVTSQPSWSTPGATGGVSATEDTTPAPTQFATDAALTTTHPPAWLTPDALDTIEIELNRRTASTVDINVEPTTEAVSPLAAESMPGDLGLDATPSTQRFTDVDLATTESADLTLPSTTALSLSLADMASTTPSSLKNDAPVVYEEGEAASSSWSSGGTSDFNYYDGVAFEDDNPGSSPADAYIPNYDSRQDEYDGDYFADMGRVRFPSRPAPNSDTKGLEIASLVRETPAPSPAGPATLAPTPAPDNHRRSDVLIEDDEDDDDDNEIESNDVFAAVSSTTTTPSAVRDSFEGQMLRRMIPLVVRQLRMGNLSPEDVERLKYIFGRYWPEVEDMARLVSVQSARHASRHASRHARPAQRRPRDASRYPHFKRWRNPNAARPSRRPSRRPAARQTNQKQKKRRGSRKQARKRLGKQPKPHATAPRVRGNTKPAADLEERALRRRRAVEYKPVAEDEDVEYDDDSEDDVDEDDIDAPEFDEEYED